MVRDFELLGPGATLAAGQALAALLQEGDVIGLLGDLGAGKTLLVQGIASGLDLPAECRVTSPTFSLVNEYRGGRLSMVHIDLYRLEDERELEHLGLEEMIEDAGVAAVEWCERFAVLPGDHLLVSIESPDSSSRRLSAQGQGPRAELLARAWARALGQGA